MSGKSFVPEIPLSWLTCPIYAQGVLLPKRNESSPDRYSDGKVPFGRAWKEELTVNDSALMIEESLISSKLLVYLQVRSQMVL